MQMGESHEVDDDIANACKRRPFAASTAVRQAVLREPLKRYPCVRPSIMSKVTRPAHCHQEHKCDPVS